MSLSRRFVAIPLAVMLLALYACSGITKSSQPAMKTWWLEPYEETSIERGSIQPRLLRLSVNVVPGLDTDHILTLSDSAELNHYSAARWAENLPELLTSLTGRTLESSGQFELVSDGTARGLDYCDLQLEFRKFFASVESSGQTRGVSLAVHGSFQCESVKGVPVQLEASVPVHDQSMKAIVAAFQQAIDSIYNDLLRKVL